MLSPIIKKTDMGEKWEDITTDLYKKIKPISGRLFSSIDSTFIHKKKLGNIFIEFDLNDFEYLDPFYGLQKSTAPFNMTLNLWDYIEPLGLKNIRQLQNLILECDIKDPIGAFSNSILFTVPLVKFGMINNEEIHVYFEYSLTNSESYGYMTGTIDDHITQKGVIELSVKIKKLQIVATDINQAIEISQNLDSTVYLCDEVREATDLKWSSPNYKGYYVSYRI